MITFISLSESRRIALNLPPLHGRLRAKFATCSLPSVELVVLSNAKHRASREIALEILRNCGSDQRKVRCRIFIATREPRTSSGAPP